MNGSFFLTECRISLKSDVESREEVGEGVLRIIGGEGVEELEDQKGSHEKVRLERKATPMGAKH